MQQNQNNQSVKNNQGREQSNIGPYNQTGQRQGNNPGYIHPPSNADDNDDTDDITEIPEEHHNKEGLPHYKNPTGEQRARDADKHEHPYSGPNTPYGGEQRTNSGQGSNNDTNRNYK